MLGPFFAEPGEALTCLPLWTERLLLSGPEEMLEGQIIPIRDGMLASTFRTKKQKRRKKNKHSRQSRRTNKK